MRNLASWSVFCSDQEVTRAHEDAGNVGKVIHRGIDTGIHRKYHKAVYFVLRGRVSPH